MAHLEIGFHKGIPRICSLNGNRTHIHIRHQSITQRTERFCRSRDRENNTVGEDKPFGSSIEFGLPTCSSPARCAALGALPYRLLTSCRNIHIHYPIQIHPQITLRFLPGYNLSQVLRIKPPTIAICQQIN